MNSAYKKISLTLTLRNKLKAGATDADADFESKKAEDCGSDATVNKYVFERISTANKKLKQFANRRTISNKLGSEQSNSPANNDDNNFSSCDNDLNDIVERRTATSETQLDIHFLWILLRDLLTSVVDNYETNETNENTENCFELNTSSSKFDYIDDTSYLTIIDGDLKDDDYSDKQKLFKQKLLGNFQSIFFKKTQQLFLSFLKFWNSNFSNQSIDSKCPTKNLASNRIPVHYTSKNSRKIVLIQNA